MPSWLQENETVIWALTVVSVVTFFATLIAIPLLILRLPADYFVRPRDEEWTARHPAVHSLLVLGKNALGFVLLLAAIAMLVLPGQGLLMMLVGVMLLDFPGKRRVERWLIMRRSICRAANWIRCKRNRPPLQLPSNG